MIVISVIEQQLLEHPGVEDVTVRGVQVEAMGKVRVEHIHLTTSATLHFTSE